MENQHYCDQHNVFSTKLTYIEEKISKLDGRLWGIVTLLIVNLAGVIGILIANIK